MSDAVEGILTVSGRLAGDVKVENRLVTIIAVEKDAVLTTEYISGSKALASATANYDGEYNVSFGFSQPTGSYDFYVVFEASREKVSYNFISLDTCAGLIKNIRDGVILKQNLISQIQEYNNGLGVDLKRFNTSLRTALLEYRLDKRRNALSGITSKQLMESFYNLIDYIEEETVFTEALNTEGYSGNIYSLLLTNQSYSGINFTAYNNLSSENKIKVTDAFSGKTFNNGDEIKSFFDTEVSRYMESLGGGAVNNSYTSGGGSSSPSGVWQSAEAEKQPEIKEFVDLDSVPWAKTAINRLYEKNLISGIGDNRFDPNTPVTREQFVKMAVTACGIYNENAKTDFLDVNENEWYYSYVGSAAQSGIINGIGDNRFGVGMNVIRQDIAVIIYNILAKYERLPENRRDDFSDMNEISDYAIDSVSYLAGAGIINGMSETTFVPKEQTTRAQAALLIYKMIGWLE